MLVKVLPAERVLAPKLLRVTTPGRPPLPAHGGTDGHEGAP